MSRRIPVLAGRERPANLAVLMREAFVAINDLVIARLAERGHGDVRPAHAAVFQYLDDTGTTVSVLADRAQMTKQAMAELVRHLEERGYLVRVPDPTDKRAKLVLPTDRGRDVIAVAQALVPEVEGAGDRPAGRRPRARPPHRPRHHPARDHRYPEGRSPSLAPPASVLRVSPSGAGRSSAPSRCRSWSARGRAPVGGHSAPRRGGRRRGRSSRT